MKVTISEVKSSVTACTQESQLAKAEPRMEFLIFPNERTQEATDVIGHISDSLCTQSPYRAAETMQPFGSHPAQLLPGGNLNW